MNFAEALGYAIKTENIPKILTIVLVSIIAGVSVFVGAMALESWWILMLILPILLGYGLFIQGYTISVIRSVMDGEETLPPFAVARDIGRGAVLFIAGIVYTLPIIAFFVCGFILIGFVGAGMEDATSDQAGLTALAMFCGMGLVSLFVMFIINFSLIVGQVRYAAEGRAGALFNVGKNFGIVMSNLGTTFGLFFRMIGIGLVFGFISSVILNVISGFFGGVSSDLFYAFERGNPDAIMKLGMPLAIFGSLYYTVSLVFNLMQTFSVAHLVAGFGAQLGFAENKLKNGDSGGGATTAIFVILAIVGVLVLIAVVTIIVLIILGPAIGEVFSEVIRDLDA